jgi:outer membrane protein
LISSTDLAATGAAHDSTAAAVIAAKRALATQQNLLREITGESYPTLAAPRDDMPLLTPDPASEDDWVTTAMSQNSSLIASRMAAEIAHDNLLSAYGGHLPSINVSVSRNWALQHVDPNNPVTTTIAGVPGFAVPVNTNDVVWAVGITVPIFTGGGTQSKVRQARYYWDAAKSGVDFSSRQTEEQTRDAFEGVVSQIAQVRALRRAVETNRLSLLSAQAAYDAGTKTVVDVLTSRDALVQAQLNYAQAKYTYLNSMVLLRLAAGTLDRSLIVQINSWLVEPASPGPAAGVQ